jgi:sterol desaturase/sphingolipid hydroxylase (fatty acid hydroxylase superfamily)
VDWLERVVIWSALLGACIVVERIDPLDPHRAVPVLARDAPWFLVYLAVAPLIARVGDLAVEAADAVPGPLAWTPVVVQAAIGLVVFDLVSYGLHRVMHRTRLWQLHRVHHGSTELTFWTAFRAHPVSALLTHVVPLAVVALLGVRDGALTAVVFVVFLVTLVGHAAVWLPPGLDRVLATPGYHRRHHDPDLAERNLVLLFPVIDRVFGTAAGAAPITGPAAPHRSTATPGSRPH